MGLSDALANEVLNKYISPKEEFAYIIYGVVEATLKELIACKDNRFYFMIITNKKIDFVELDLGCRPINSFSISLSEIEHIRFSGWMMGFGRQLSIKLREGNTIKFKASKKTMGLTTQKENLIKIEKYFTNRVFGEITQL